MGSPLVVGEGEGHQSQGGKGVVLVDVGGSHRRLGKELLKFLLIGTRGGLFGGVDLDAGGAQDRRPLGTLAGLHGFRKTMRGSNGYCECSDGSVESSKVGWIDVQKFGCLRATTGKTFDEEEVVGQPELMAIPQWQGLCGSV